MVRPTNTDSSLPTNEWSPVLSFAQLRADRTLLPRDWGVYVTLYREEQHLLLRYVGSSVSKDGLWGRVLFDREDALKSLVPEHIRERILVTYLRLPRGGAAAERSVRDFEGYLRRFLQPPGNTLSRAEALTTHAQIAAVPGEYLWRGVCLLERVEEYAQRHDLKLVTKELPWLLLG